jgi:hypothetical protein
MFATDRAEIEDLEASLQDLQTRDAALSVMRDLIDEVVLEAGREREDVRVELCAALETA